jgi:hypothetical protein
MEIIKDQLASLWLSSPIGVAIVLGLAALLLLGVPARIIDYVEQIGWRRHFARRRRPSPGVVAVAKEGVGSARMSG